MAKLDDFFRIMVAQHASDLHLAAGSQPLLRLQGTLKNVDAPPLTNDVLQPMLYEILTEAQIEHFEKTRDLDLAYTAPDIARFRINIFQKLAGIAAGISGVYLCLCRAGGDIRRTFDQGKNVSSEGFVLYSLRLGGQ